MRFQGNTDSITCTPVRPHDMRAHMTETRYVRTQSQASTIMAFTSLLFLQSCLFAVAYGQYRDGDIRLVGGSYQWEGRVEIYFSGTWGTITDSEWSSDDAQVACRKLGYFKPGASGQNGAYFGQGSGPIHLDHVLCSGTEYNLTDCETGKTRRSNHSEDVGVKCQTILQSYGEGDIRLVNGSYNWEGRVEIFLKRTWNTIYATSWTSAEAQVVCRQLGHLSTGATPHSCCAHFGQGSGLAVKVLGSCAGHEANISSCLSHINSTSSHQHDVGVQCYPGDMHKEGDIRLVGGSYSWQGRVEIYLYGEWGTISYPYTIRESAHVVCVQLGYDTRYGYADVGFYLYPFRGGTGPIHINDLKCSGTEYRLIDCTYDEEGSSRHSEDWGVSCKNDGPRQSGEVRLYYSYAIPNYFLGRVEVYMSDEWGSVADDGNWTLEDGEVVCRQLGFEISRDAIILSGTFYTPKREDIPIYMSNVQCSGNESSLIDCPYISGGIGGDAELFCKIYHDNTYCRTGQLRLTGGETEMEGRVEVCDNFYRWGTVCNKQWTSAHTKVTCRNLGYRADENGYEESYVFGEGYIPIIMDYVSCNGSEHRLWDCPHFTHSYGCNHTDDVGVRCQPAQCDDGDVRLVMGDTASEGQVQVCISKRWGTICRHGWSSDDAATVCRQLGYSDGTYSYRFWRSGAPMHLSQVDCSGSEFRIFDCSYKTDAANECGSNQNSGVFCNSVDCSDGEVRLVEGESEWEGRLEVCFSRRWGTVSSDGWTQTNTQVVCNDLGYECDTETDYSPRPATNSMPIYMNHVQCSENVLSLLDCSYSRNTSNSAHSNDVGVKCKKSSCSDGDLRFVGGYSEFDGLLQVCFDQRWGTINGDGWSYSDNQVVCRQKGFEITGEHSTSSLKSFLSAPIFMDNVACYGNEDKLIDCTYHTDTSEDDHSDDIWVKCSIEPAIASSRTTATSDKATTMAMAMFGLTIGILLIIIAFLIGCVLYYHRKMKPSSERAFYRITSSYGDTGVHTDVKAQQQEKGVYQELEEEAAKSVGDKIETQLLPKEPTEEYESVDALST